MKPSKLQKENDTEKKKEGESPRESKQRWTRNRTKKETQKDPGKIDR